MRRSRLFRLWRFLRRFILLGFDTRIARYTQVLRPDSLAERLVQRRIQRFVIRFLSILPTDDAGRHFTRAKAGHFDRLADLAQTLFDIFFEISRRKGKVQTALQRTGCRRCGVVSMGGGILGVRIRIGCVRFH